MFSSKGSTRMSSRIWLSASTATDDGSCLMGGKRHGCRHETACASDPARAASLDSSLSTRPLSYLVLDDPEYMIDPRGPTTSAYHYLSWLQWGNSAKYGGSLGEILSRD